MICLQGRRKLPHEACEYMLALAETKLDRDVLIQFLKIVSIYPTGTSVRLSNRETGVVVGQHRGLPTRSDYSDREAGCDRQSA